MTATRDPRALVALAVALAASACASHRPPPASPTPAVSPAPAASRDNASTAEMEAIYRARLDSARSKFNAADVRFMDGMIMHHAQALVMAAMAPTHGASSAVQTLCSRIINAQNDEIHTMQQWLRERGQPVPQVQIMGTMVMVTDGAGHDMPHDMTMPGMLTPEQMAQLDAARGAQFDRLFLTGMIQHHKGAVTMVKALFDTPGSGEDEAIFKYASDVNVDQTTEIARMERMLSQLPSAGGAR